MGFPILVRYHHYIESGPWGSVFLTQEATRGTRSHPYPNIFQLLYFHRPWLFTNCHTVMEGGSPHDHWDPKVVTAPTLSSLEAPHVVFMTTCSDTSNQKVGIMTTLHFQCSLIMCLFGCPCKVRPMTDAHWVCCAGFWPVNLFRSFRVTSLALGQSILWLPQCQWNNHEEHG